MINNNEKIQEYTNNNKIYIPQIYNNQNYKYTIDNYKNITIITNQNCNTNYNTTYCDCYKYNPELNIISSLQQCNNTPNTGIINYNMISSDINNSIRITRDYVNDYTIIFGTIIIALLFIILMKRNSRNI